MHPGMSLLLSALTELGFRKRVVGMLTLDLGDGWLGWIGLNTASRAGAVGNLLVHPIIGVRCQAVEAGVAQGRGERMHAYQPPTTSEPLRYLVPAEARRDWVFAAGGQPADQVVDDLVAAVRDYGLPFIHALTSLDALGRRLGGFVGRDGQAAYRWLVVLWLSGDVEGVVRGIERVRGLLGERRDRASEELREFTTWLEKELRSEG